MVERYGLQLSRRLLAIATGLTALYLVFLTGQRAIEAYRINREVDGIRQEIVRLRDRNVVLQAQLASPRTDEELERVAREEMGLARPGDHPVVLLWPESSSRTARAIAEPGTSSMPYWQAWVRLFVDLDLPER